ncbi:MAG: hypothetical protein WBF97_13775, partial [Comamonas sp.]
KQNFLYNRPFTDTDSLNAEALAWLARTANALAHGTTHKHPCREWEIEKPFLRPCGSLTPGAPKMALYAVRKDNSFSYKGNFYSLPCGTYQGRGSQVLLERQGDHLVLYSPDRRELCRHPVSSGSGEKIINNDHRREKSQAIQELEERFYNLVSTPDQARQLVAAIRQDKPRYIRDQLLLLIQTVQPCPADITQQALAYCLEAGTKGAADFKSIVQHFSRQADVLQEPAVYLNPLNRKTPAEALIQPQTSSIDDYQLF